MSDPTVSHLQSALASCEDDRTREHIRRALQRAVVDFSEVSA